MMPSKSQSTPLTRLLTGKWWIYQQERFPLLKNGISMVVFSLSAVCHSFLLRQGWDERTRSGEILVNPTLFVGATLIATLVLFGLALQVRIASEYRDVENNTRFHPNYPVQRGLVSLRELGVVAIATGAIQLGLTLALKPALIPLLAIAWAYLALLSQNFFIPAQFKLNPLLYRAIRTLIMPLMGLYATACDWLVVGASSPKGLIWFLLVSFLAGMAIEVSRKIRAPRDEKAGVQTYTAQWGLQKAVMAWLGITWLLFLASLLSAMYIAFTGLMFLLLLVLLTGAVIVAWRFLARPITLWAKRFELVSGIWAIAIYLGLGIIPFMLR